MGQAERGVLHNHMDARADDIRIERVAPTPPVMDYEGSHYRTDFWDGQSRQYEDAVERLALQAMLPSQGGRIAEIGAGFGRLADLYLGYDQIILFDYSRSLLQDAVGRWGHDPRFVFVAGNVYDLPLAGGLLDTLVMVRVMHHLVDVPRALGQLHRVLHRDSVAVVEYANKRNLKAMGRWLLGRQRWSPLDAAPVEFVELNFDFHPTWMWHRFEQARFHVVRQWAVSHFRLPLLKHLIPAQQLARFDAKLFGIGGRFPLSPSVFAQLTLDEDDKLPGFGSALLSHSSRVDRDANRDTETGKQRDYVARVRKMGASPTDVNHNDVEHRGTDQEMPEQRIAKDGGNSGSNEPGLEDELAMLFCCPRCFSTGSFYRPQVDRLVCRVCDAGFAQRDKIWDFKEVLE